MTINPNSRLFNFKIELSTAVNITLLKNTLRVKDNSKNLISN